MFFSLLLLDFLATVLGGCKDCSTGCGLGLTGEAAARLTGGAGDLPDFRAMMADSLWRRTKPKIGYEKGTKGMT